jgi:hypothetical protein
MPWTHPPALFAAIKAIFHRLLLSSTPSTTQHPAILNILICLSIHPTNHEIKTINHK